MPAFSGTYQYLAPGRGAVQQGSAQVSFDREAVTIVGPGPAIGFDLGDIDAFEAGDYDLCLRLYTGHAVRLERFGKAFQDLKRQLTEAYRDRLVQCLLVGDLDEVARYDGRVHLESARATCDGAAEIRLYESNVAVLPDAAPGFQWRLAEVEAVELDERDYAVVLRRRDETLHVGRLAKRTGEFADRLRGRIDALGERSARALHAVFPYLSPEQFRHLSALMREGTSAPLSALRAIHRLVEPSLLETVAERPLRPYIRALVDRGVAEGVYAGFKIIRRDVETGEDDGDEAAPQGAVAPADEAVPDGVESDATDAVPGAAVTDLGDGLEALLWVFVPLAPRAGGEPTHLAWEATTRGGRATYVFRMPAGDASAARVEAAVRGINDGLVAVNFRREPVYLGSDTLESEARYRHYAIAARRVPGLATVRRAFAGRAIHRSLSAWRAQVDALVAG
jgi:hypothetical protein